MFASVDVFPIAPACMYQASLIGQSLSAGMNFFRLSSVGICSLSPCSTTDPRDSGYFALNQYVGALQLYGPSMWMPSHWSPLGPLAKEETVSTTAFCQCASEIILRYSDRKSTRLNSSHLGIS